MVRRDYAEGEDGARVVIVRVLGPSMRGLFIVSRVWKGSRVKGTPLCLTTERP